MKKKNQEQSNKAFFNKSGITYAQSYDFMVFAKLVPSNSKKTMSHLIMKKQ